MLFTKKRSRWERLARSVAPLASPARNVAHVGRRLASRPVVKAAVGATGAAVAATAASAAASTARRGGS